MIEIYMVVLAVALTRVRGDWRGGEVPTNDVYIESCPPVVTVDQAIVSP